ncbi:hypothetical protein G039_0322020 [Pseudomonas aeruginosa VRFPA01]|nr:hypothetical protein G039_0322020 [Pseudomonas aeruginosa VRFPA01]
MVICLVVELIVAAGKREPALEDVVLADRLAAHPTESTGEHLAGTVAILQAAHLVGQRRVDAADLLALGVGEYVEQRLGDGQVIALVGQVIVAAGQHQAALVDAIHAHVLARGTVQPAGEDRACAVAVLQTADLVGQARVGIAVDLGLGVGDHVQQRLGDGQVIALVGQVVVAAVQCQVALVDAVHAHVLARGAVQATGQDRTGAVAILQPADSVGQARVGIAVDLGLGIGDHVQQRLGDGQVVALVGQVVVAAVQCQVALVDAIHAHVLARGAVQAAGEDRAGAVAVLQPADLVGQARVGVAIDLGLGVGDHVQQRLGDGQVVALVIQVVVRADQPQAALVDAIDPDVLARHATQAAAVEHGAGAVAVLQPADLVGQARVGVAIDLGLGIGDHVQQRLGD